MDPPTMNVAPPYSQCDSRGRCIRHPSVQMSRKKKLGGWKKLLGICPMCAMELMASENADAAVVRAISESDAASLHSQSSRRHRRAPRVGHHDEDDRSLDNRSVDRSVLSAPSAYHRSPAQVRRRRGQPTGNFKRGSVGSSDSSCDTTVDLSYASEGSSLAGSRASQGSRGQWQQHQQRPHQGHGYNPQQRQQHYAHDQGYDQAPPQYGGRSAPSQEEFVCGMELYVDRDTRCYYTGQIDAVTRLPHGLGTLRGEADGSILEGSWEHGVLVQENNVAAQQAGLPAVNDHEEYQQPLEYDGYGDQEEYQPQQGNYNRREQYDQGGDGPDYCMPCAAPPPPQDQYDQYENDLANEFSRAHVGDDESSESYFSETLEVKEDLEQWATESEAGSSRSSYSARESVRSGRSGGSGRRVRFQEDP